MMDPVFDAQFRLMKDAFARQGIEIAVAFTPAGEVDYLYQVGRLLTVDSPEGFARLNDILPGLRRADRADQTDSLTSSGLVVLSINELAGGQLSVPEALDLIDERLGAQRHTPRPDAEFPVTPVHVLHVARICPAVEPEPPNGGQVAPWPAPCTLSDAQGRREQVRLGVSDTGLLQDIADFSWLDGVNGEVDELSLGAPGGPARIPEYAGHGTFVAGVARCMAPSSEVYVNNHFSLSGGELEHVIIEKLEQLVMEFRPEVINLSAGTYSRKDWPLLGMRGFLTAHPEITLVAAAGNDSTDRPFYPAALPEVVAVGALGIDQIHRAWFSNYGEWVDVYALGEGLVNAYAKGVYTYQEPPKRPAKQTFHGLARWDGTSFSAPLVAGLIAARMAGTGESSRAASNALLELAESQRLPGVGPALYPCQVD